MERTNGVAVTPPSETESQGGWTVLLLRNVVFARLLAVEILDLKSSHLLSPLHLYKLRATGYKLSSIIDQ